MKWWLLQGCIEAKCCKRKLEFQVGDAFNSIYAFLAYTMFYMRPLACFGNYLFLYLKWFAWWNVVLAIDGDVRRWFDPPWGLDIPNH